MSHKVLNNVFLKDLGKIDVTSLKTDLLVIPVSTHTKKNNSFKTLDKLSKGYLNKVCNNHFKDKNAPILLPAMQGIAAKNIMLVKDKDSEAQTYKWLDFFASISAKGNSINAKDIAFLVTGNIPKNKDINWFIETAARSFEAGAYIFSETKNKTAKKPSLKNVHLLVDGLSTKELTAAKKSAKQGFAIGEGMNAAKYLGDLPANHATPRIIERKTKALSKEFPKLKVKSLNEKELAKLGMGSYLSVAKGSDEPPRMMIVEYKGGKASDKPIALVGKGITFDTGGISLKPSPAMDEMKWDMCGAASVFGIMTTLARLNADVNVVGILACAENMPSAKATKPGDVVTSMSGQTIEILNTDAEGRLVLCDALTYVGRYKPSYVIDMATLTGAVVVALGRHASGVMSNDQFLADKILEAGENTGDRAWQLPLWDEYMSCTKTNFADLANIGGGREAGTITAAAFLSKFTEDYKWAHIDIAASAWYSSPKKGGTGRPVPLISELILSKKLK